MLSSIVKLETVRRKISLFLLGIGGILFIAEVFVAKFNPQLTFSKVKSVSFACHEADSILPFSLKKNSVCQMKDLDGDYDTFATTNSFGIRGKEISREKPPGVTRILMLGDSFTFGIGVTDKETFSAKMEELLRLHGQKVEVLNAGYTDGYSPGAYYLYLKARGVKFKPDIVIMNFFVWNDITDHSENVWEKTDTDGLPEKIVSGYRVVDEGVFVQKVRPLRYRIPFIRELNLFQLLMNFLEDGGMVKMPVSTRPKRDLMSRCIFSPACIDKFAAEEKSAYKMIAASKKIADEKNIKFILVLIPVDFQLYPQAWGKYGPMILNPYENKDFIQKRIKSKLVIENISILDLYPIFDAKRDLGFPYFPHDAHFNALGHQITANAIYEYLMENKIVQ